MAIHEYILETLRVGPTYTILSLSLLAFFVLRILYRLSPLHPLYKVPGPTLAKLTSLWLAYYSKIGKECSQVHIEHERYGNLVRTGPNSVHIRSGDALHDIYTGGPTTKTSGQGFLKPEFYRNFDIDGHATVFSATDPAYRTPRAKAMTPIFSSTALRRGAPVLDACSKRMVARLEREKARASTRTGDKKGVVDILNVTRGLAIDVITDYLFGVLYGGCDEDLYEPDVKRGKKKPKLTASAFVHAFASIGRFWYLDRRVFAWVNWMSDTLFPDHEARDSQRKVDEFTWSVVDQAEDLLLSSLPATANGKPSPSTNTTSTIDDGATFQTRLLSASILPSEIHAHCKDLIFAGTDSTPMNLANMMHRLAGNQSALERVTAEIEASDPSADPQTLPVLRAVVFEGLRLAMANPTRLVRVVPPTGWTYDGVDFPAGTHVGCSMWELHHNPTVFPDPWAYRPERWLEAGGEQLEVMNRDCMPFGMGARGCIARNLATAELYWAMREVIRRGVLDGGSPVGKVEIVEWFNARVEGDKIEVRW